MILQNHYRTLTEATPYSLDFGVEFVLLSKIQLQIKALHEEMMNEEKTRLYFEELEPSKMIVSRPNKTWSDIVKGCLTQSTNALGSGHFKKKG